MRIKTLLDAAMRIIGSRASMPKSASAVTVGEASITAPFDGYAMIRGVATATGDWISVSSGDVSSTVVVPSAGHVPVVYIPVAKAGGVIFSASPTMKDVVKQMVRTIGG